MDRNHEEDLVMANPLLEELIGDDPAVLFQRWLEEAGRVQKLPTAACLSTAALPSGRVSSRMVNVAEFNPGNSTFVINSDWQASKKAQDVLSGNAHAALLFYWPEIGRSVRIEGRIDILDAEESAARSKFSERPRLFQAVVASGEQSVPVPDRATLESGTRSLETLKEIEMPSWWRAGVLVPDMFEFWQNRTDRISDRIRFSLGDGWERTRLHP